MAFLITSVRLRTARGLGVRGLARFGANGAKTCISVLLKHFGELAKAACAPKLLKESSKNFFVFQHVPATPISAGSYGRLFLPPLIFVKKDAYIYGVLYFIYSKKTSKSCIFTHGAPPCSEQSCNQAMFSRHPRATRGIACRISPPLPPKINVERCCNGPEPTLQH